MQISVQESYDKIAKEFSVTRVFTWTWTDNFINNLIIPNSFILDIGSGNGRNTKYKNHTIFGIDISLQQLKSRNENNMKNNNLKSNNFDCQANMTEIPFRSNTFDALLSIASFHHLKNDYERRKCLKEMNRVLKPNGKMLLSVWSINQPKKTKRIFRGYGDTIVYWNKPNSTVSIPRYYYIFEVNEIKKLLSEFFVIEKYYWDCGNEIFELVNK
jgi:ubiquinone/menaquinone biosynthesis C-methylase UbiE